MHSQESFLLETLTGELDENQAGQIKMLGPRCAQQKYVDVPVVEGSYDLLPYDSKTFLSMVFRPKALICGGLSGFLTSGLVAILTMFPSGSRQLRSPMKQGFWARKP